MIDTKVIKNLVNNEEIIILNDDQLKRYISRKIVEYIADNNVLLDIDEIKEYSEKIFNEIRGLGIIEEFLKEDDINEIMINSYNEIFIERKGIIEESRLIFEDNDEYNRIIQKIVGDAGREVNMSNPIADVMLYDGSRVNIVLPPISKDDPCVTIRRFSREDITIKDLIDNNTINHEVAKFLKKLIIAKYNIVIGGGTSSGKTTFLNALSQFIPENERVVTIEDTRELNLLNKKNLISMETRQGSSGNRGEINIKRLIKNSLRMRPDRIIVGEVRADETLDMLQAMNTGHDGALTTAHANSTLDMISRLETMVLRSGENIPLEAIKRMISSSIEILIQIRRIGEDKRRITEISELYQDKNGDTKINKIYEYNYEKDQIVKISELINTRKMERIYEG